MTAIPPTVTMVNPPVASIEGSPQIWSLPPKLVKKILHLEYVDMTELLPDAWLTQEEDQRCCHSLHRPQRREPVTDNSPMGGMLLNHGSNLGIKKARIDGLKKTL